jgi:Immunity protein 7
MFEGHGWATIRSGAGDTVEGVGEPAGPLQTKIAELNSSANVIVRLDIDLNGSDALTVVAFKNHRKEQVIELFQWLAQHRPASYRSAPTRFCRRQCRSLKTLTTERARCDWLRGCDAV